VPTPDDETTVFAESAFNLGLEFGDAEWATQACNGGKSFPDDR
jgi:hypothetical protein